MADNQLEVKVSRPYQRVDLVDRASRKPEWASLVKTSPNSRAALSEVCVLPALTLTTTPHLAAMRTAAPELRLRLLPTAAFLAALPLTTRTSEKVGLRTMPLTLMAATRRTAIASGLIESAVPIRAHLSPATRAVGAAKPTLSVVVDDSAMIRTLAPTLPPEPMRLAAMPKSPRRD